MSYKIEKNISIAEALTSRNKYPFPKMKVGDSFFVEDIMDKHVVRAAAYSYGKYHGKKFRTRTVDGGVRVWRIE